MRQLFSSRGKRIGSVGILLLAGVAAALWLEREPLRAWYAVRGLCAASETERDGWVERVVACDAAVVPWLAARLTDPDVRVCANVQTALVRLLKAWGEEPDKRADLADHLTQTFPRASRCGQKTILAVVDSCASARTTATASLIAACAAQADRELLTEAFKLVTTIVEGTHLCLYPSNPFHDKALLQACRELVQACLKVEDAAVRLKAVRLAFDPSVDLREQVVPLLGDADPAVRRAVMLVVGPTPEAVSTDELLRWLHDPDEDVRQLCETALRGRGLREEHLRLGKHLTDARPATRLKVLDLLSESSDLEPGAWLRRLSHDPAPAVRAAAVRAAVAQPHVDLTDRIRQMAQDDPSATVRQLARFYLSSRMPAGR
jgi:HEAT repeats